MTVRTIRSTILFNAPFTLPGFADALPAGRYDIETDEAAFEGTTRTVYRRVATSLRIETAGRIEHHPVDPKDLDAALKRDRDARNAPSPTADSAEPGLPTDVAAPTTIEAILTGKPWRSIPLWIRTRRADRRS